ncbi:MAG: aminoacyl-tRNA hydrolase [Parachlamydiaceae bacterium]|nr:aminoacyl-tRNA hydrolase [Parachlamydiaceae bacterium]
MAVESSETQYVIVGLGNPGREYALTRHNMGYLTVQALAAMWGLSFKEEKQFQAFVAKGKVEGITVHLLLPTTYMNESGRALRLYLDFFKVGHNRLCVVCDDLHLSFGELRVRSIGSAGGHNGLKSIQSHLGTQHYVRLRIGIGREQLLQACRDYVLEAFSHEEQQELPKILEDGAKVLQRLVGEELPKVMNAVNTRISKSGEQQI